MQRDPHFFIKMGIRCGVHTTSNFNDPNCLFFKLHLINHPSKILGKSEKCKYKACYTTAKTDKTEFF